jgi:serine/threonine protein kinase
MSDFNFDLDLLADKIGDLAPIDWEQAARESKLQPGTSLSENLRVLARIASFETDELDASTGPRAWGPFELLELVTVDEEGERWAARGESHQELEILWPPSHHHDPHHARVELLAAARALIDLRHPNLVEILGADAFDGRLGVWMRSANGRTLESLSRNQGRLSPRAWIRLGHELCDAVEAIHGRGRFLCALPPSGVVIDEKGHARIRRLPHLRSASNLRPGETLPALGSYHFAAPELLTGAAPTRASDVFTLAALLSWVMEEDPDLASLVTLEKLREHRNRTPRFALLPREPAELLRACLQREPGRRPPTPTDLRELWESATMNLVPSDWPSKPRQSPWRELWRRLTSS